MSLLKSSINAHSVSNCPIHPVRIILLQWMKKFALYIFQPFFDPLYNAHGQLRQNIFFLPAPIFTRFRIIDRLCPAFSNFLSIVRIVNDFKNRRDFGFQPTSSAGVKWFRKIVTGANRDNFCRLPLTELSPGLHHPYHHRKSLSGFKKHHNDSLWLIHKIYGIAYSVVPSPGALYIHSIGYGNCGHQHHLWK